MRTLILLSLFLSSCIEEKSFYKNIRLTNMINIPNNYLEDKEGNLYQYINEDSYYFFGRWLDKEFNLFLRGNTLDGNTTVSKYINGMMYDMGIGLCSNDKLVVEKDGISYLYKGNDQWENMYNGMIYKYTIMEGRGGIWHYFGKWLNENFNLFLHVNNTVSKYINGTMYDMGIGLYLNDKLVVEKDGISYLYKGNDQWENVHNGMTYKYIIIEGRGIWQHCGSWLMKGEVRMDINNKVYQFEGNGIWKETDSYDNTPIIKQWREGNDFINGWRKEMINILRGGNS